MILVEETQETKIESIQYSGTTCPCDIALYDKHYSIVLLSFYGSMSQIKAIFSALLINNTIFVYPHHIKKSTRGCKLKTTKIGHGKYHAIIYDAEYKKDTILMLNEDQELETWIEFLKKTKIPIIDEWIPKLINLLKEEELIYPLNGHGMKGYKWEAEDNTACDIIIEKIYTL